ncbi:MAG TPA: polyketide synthase, partial [Ktedonobacteraceae bacterium]|nr:polyketide synthase [Ktedonobacteraceae bacterium]
MNNMDTSTALDAVAIIGMAGRFPGARTLEEFWRNLCNGVESISSFTDAELLASGIDQATINSYGYMKSRAILDDVELFDASFFNYTPREAEIIDPQQRVFLECAWESLEHAGYDPETYQKRIGVYAGSSMNSYVLSNLYANRERLRLVNPFQITISNEKDFLSTRLSYKLNLKGPSLTVQTACSTSLVAVHLACQSLLNGECDMALAGGVSITIPQKMGAFYQEGGIISPDGHCRAFDAKAQ